MGKIGRYEIIAVLHQGGSGEVILAQDENLGRRVAIKRPFRSAVAGGIARFRVEAKAGTLLHPNIPTVYEMGADDDLPFIAMEYVEGETLEAMIASRRELDLMARLRIMEQVCLALGCAHKSGIVHRDVKAANIMVRPDGTAKIIDFGHARLREDETESGSSSEKWDGGADIFSAGVTLFRVLAGAEPFAGGALHARLGAYLREYPPALDRIVEKALARHPGEGYHAAEDFADALHDVIAGLKRTRVAELYKEAERLNGQGADAPALKVLDQVMRMEPSHPASRKLRKAIRERQEHIRREDRLREYLIKSDEALRAGNFDDALSKLKDAFALDGSSAEALGRMQALEEQKRRFESSMRALTEAEDMKAHGDVTGAMRIVSRALEQDPENEWLASLHIALGRVITIDAQRGRLMDLQEGARGALALRDYDAAETLLGEAAAIDPSDPEIENLRKELGRAREAEQRVSALGEVRERVHALMGADAYEAARDMVDGALDKMPNEIVLRRLKAEVEAEAAQFDVRSIVDLAIARAKEVFAKSPLEALGILEKASENIPGDERLAECERGLRRQLEGSGTGQLREETVRRARALIDARQAEKAVGVLESFQGKFGPHAEIDGLLIEARGRLGRRRA